MEETNTQIIPSAGSSVQPADDMPLPAANASSAPPVEPSAAPVPPIADLPAGALAPEPLPENLSVQPSVVPTVSAPAQAEAPAAASPPSNPAPSAAPSSPVAPVKGLGQLLAKLKAKLTSRTQKRLDKIMVYARKHGSITNDEAQKLVYVSDATATRYLVKLVKQGQLKVVGKPKRPKYTPV